MHLPSEILFFPALRELSAKTLPLPQLAERSQHCAQHMGLVPKRRVTRWLQRLGSPAYFQELHSLKSSSSLLMCVCGREERKHCGGKRDKQETSHLSNVGGHFLLFPPFPRPAVKSSVSPAMPAASATGERAAIITWNGWNHLAGPTGEEVCKFIWNKTPKNP